MQHLPPSCCCDAWHCLPPPVQCAARVRALEEKLPDAERRIKRYLPPGSEAPSKAVGQVGC